VPPVEIISKPFFINVFENSVMPVLSETLISALLVKKITTDIRYLII